MMFKQVLNLIGDYQYNCPVDHLANLLANQNDKIYKYSFDVRNPMDSWPKWSGVKHGAELDYLFGRPILSDNKLFTSEHTRNDVIEVAQLPCPVADLQDVIFRLQAPKRLEFKLKLN